MFFESPPIYNLVQQARRPLVKRLAKPLTWTFSRLLSSLRDLAPIILVIGFFQIVVLQQPFPNFWGVTVGLLGVGLLIAGWRLRRNN